MAPTPFPFLFRSCAAPAAPAAAGAAAGAVAASLLLLAPAAQPAAAAPATAPALAPALESFTPGVVGGNEEFAGTIGYGFTTSRGFAISALGFWDDFEDGLLAPHQVGIFDALSSALLVAATVPSGDGTALQNGFRWVAIPRFDLPPGSYVIGATMPGTGLTSFDPLSYEVSDPLEAAGFTIGTASLSAAIDTASLLIPQTDEGLPYGFIGPNFAEATPVPAPLPLMGAAATWAWSRRLRRRIRRAPGSGVAEGAAAGAAVVGAARQRR
jgi:hypothetical protein